MSNTTIYNNAAVNIKIKYNLYQTITSIVRETFVTLKEEPFIKLRQDDGKINVLHLGIMKRSRIHPSS